MSLKVRINEDMKVAMKARDTARLGTIRLLIAATRQKEIDERCELDDAGIVVVVDKMLKQRRDSIAHYTAAGRQDLVDKEKNEIEVLMGYLPQQLSHAEIDTMIAAVIADSGATSIQDIGKIMAVLKPMVAGRADLAQLSLYVKAQLADCVK